MFVVLYSMINRSQLTVTNDQAVMFPLSMDVPYFVFGQDNYAPWLFPDQRLFPI
jgi:hypothetical protein